MILFWFKTSIAASSMRVQCKSPNTLLGVIPLGSSTQTNPLRNIASVDTNIFLIAGLACMKDSALVGILFLVLAAANLANTMSAQLDFVNQAGGLALMLALIAWFWTDHSKSDFVPCFWGSIGVIVASILIRMLAEWILERPTRAERRAMKRAAAPTFDSRL